MGGGETRTQDSLWQGHPPTKGGLSLLQSHSAQKSPAQLSPSASKVTYLTLSPAPVCKGGDPADTLRRARLPGRQETRGRIAEAPPGKKAAPSRGKAGVTCREGRPARWEGGPSQTPRAGRSERRRSCQEGTAAQGSSVRAQECAHPPLAGLFTNSCLGSAATASAIRRGRPETLPGTSRGGPRPDPASVKQQETGKRRLPVCPGEGGGWAKQT